MSLDLSNPDHEAALRFVCDFAVRIPAQYGLAVDPTWMAQGTKPPNRLAWQALSSPASAAELIRQLVERAGLSVCGYHSQRRGAFVSMQHDDTYLFVEIVNHFVGQVPNGYTYKSADFAPLIARLLALAPNTGAEAVLRALRGET